MPYFIIFLVFAVSFVAAALGTSIAWFWRPLRPVFPFAWRAWLWGTLGFLVSNALLIAAIFAIGQLEKTVTHGSWPYKSMEIVGFGLVVLGPFAASTIGGCTGALLGCFLAWRASQASVRSQTL